MRTKTPVTKASAEQVVKDIRRATRKQYSAEDKIRIVLEGQRRRLQPDADLPGLTHRTLGLLTPCPDAIAPARR